MQIAQNSEDLKKRLEKYKEECHHSNANCVLLPVTGAINNVKGNIFYSQKQEQFKVYNNSGRPPINRDDRPDTLIYFLSKFWDIKDKEGWSLRNAGLFLSNSIFSYSLLGDNFGTIYDFLNLFKSLKEFCYVMFGMNEYLTASMKENGKNPMTNEDSLRNYLNLAEAFWRHQN